LSKKLLTSLMVMAVLLAGAAMAGEMQYKVYGKAHVSTEMLDNGQDSSIFISSNSTRLGVKGSYATNYEYFTVVFQYESAADFNGETYTGLSTRNSFAGLKGDWGRLIWGRHDTPLYSLGRSVDFFDSRIGDIRNVTAFDFGPEGDSLLGYDLRVPNMIMYTTPLLGECVTVDLQYVPEEGADSEATLFSGSAVYDKDGIMVGVGFENHGKGTFADPDDFEDIDASNAIRAVAGYTGDVFSIKGLFQTVSNLDGDEDLSGTTFGIGASYMATSAWELKGQYYMMDFSIDNVDPEPEDLGNALLALGVDYHLNEQALLYLAFAMSMNEDFAYNAPYYGGHGQDYPVDFDVDENDDDIPDILGESAMGIALGLIADF